MDNRALAASAAAQRCANERDAREPALQIAPESEMEMHLFRLDAAIARASEAVGRLGNGIDRLGAHHLPQPAETKAPPMGPGPDNHLQRLCAGAERTARLADEIEYLAARLDQAV